MATPANTPNTSRASIADRSAQTVKAKYTQGAPLVDVNVNAVIDYLHWQSTDGERLRSDVVGGDTPLAELAIRPVEVERRGVDAVSDRNADNFAIQLGRVSTRNGVLNLLPLMDPALKPYVIFDYKKVVDAGATDVADRPYGNHLFMGQITSSGAGLDDQIVDASKKFQAHHRLTKYSGSVTTGGMKISHAYAPQEPETDVQPLRLDVYEDPARIVVLTGANAGEERTIDSLVSETTLSVNSPFKNAFAEGDTYVIVPSNQLEVQRSIYDAAKVADSYALIPGSVATAVGFVVAYLHVWQEDLDGVEDPSLDDPNLNQVTWHNTQLRWCVRTAHIRTDDAAGTDRPHPYHLKALLTNMGYQPLSDLDAGGANIIEESMWADMNTVAHVDRDMSSPSWHVWEGLTAYHFFRLKGDRTRQNLSRLMLDTYEAALQYLAGDAGDIVALLATCPEQKGDDSDTLSPNFVPLRTHPAEAPGIERPRLNTYYKDGSIRGAVIFARMPLLMSQRDAALELVRARSLNARTDRYDLLSTGGYAGLPQLFETDTGMYAPLLYNDLPSHLSHLDTMVQALMGVGQSAGTTNPNVEVDGQQSPRRMASSKVIKDTVAGEILGAGGHNSSSFVPTVTTHMMNADALLIGRVHMVDPLAGATATEDDYQFLAGPGQYIRRDGTAVDPDSDDGWSFYRYLGPEPYQEGDKTRFRLRNPSEGTIQANVMRDSLSFRKLAMKTTGFMDAELFTFNVQHPAWVNDGNAMLEPGAETGNGYSSVGAFLRGNQARTSASISAQPVSRESYAVGTFKSTTGNPHRGIGAPQPDHDGGYPLTDQARGTGSVESSGGPNPMDTPAANRRIDEDYGAWGRFDYDHTAELADTVNMIDTWANRCTVGRLRYHIGDFYPAPNGTSNALVDNMMLYVRIEPLSLVHWATMPRHQHSVIENSLLAWDGLVDLIAKVAVTADTSNLVDSDGNPLVTEASPDRNDTPSSGSEVGDISWRQRPFDDKHQPFVHWYHPMQEYIQTPHGGGNGYHSIGNLKFSVYNKWGERSLIAPGIVAHADFGAGGISSDFITPNEGAPSSTAEERWESGDLTSTSASGNHLNFSPGVSSDDSVTMDDAGAFNVDDKRWAFPFTPYDPEDTFVGGTILSKGVPGPVFLPAYRTHAKGLLTDIGGGDNIGYHEAFEAIDTTLVGATGTHDQGDGDWMYFPQTDKLLEPGSFGAAWGAGSLRTPNSAYDWSIPVMRAHIRTDTVAAILDSLQATARLPNSLETSYPSQADPQPGVGPDVDTDTLFIGDLGTSLARAASGSQSFFQSPLMFGGAWDNTTAGNGRPLHIDKAAGTSSDVVNDAFELAAEERYWWRFNSPGDGSKFIPLIGTFSAIRYMGMQQKLLWNSSIRVLHVRPGGGWRGAGAVKSRATTSKAPKSLTELFLVRNRQTGQAVPLPDGPTGPTIGGFDNVTLGNKTFLHLESAHPAANSVITIEGHTTSVHPNASLMGHLYPMIVDSLGAYGESAGVGRQALYQATADPNHDIEAAHFTNTQVITGLTGDTYAADPFDWAFAQASDPGSQTRVANTDRLHQNSGIEIDVLNELRYVRNKAAAHGIDQAGFGGVTWADLMPTEDEISAPGDHEIMFVLYTGSYGQQMVDSEVPHGYNPPFAGCRIIATLEVNRSSERVPSDDGPGEHYGVDQKTWHILGHG